MKKIIRTKAVITNVFGLYRNTPNKGNSRNNAYLSIKVNGKIVACKKTLLVPARYKVGDHITVWYAQDYPDTLYNNHISAFIFGKKNDYM